MAIDSLFLSPPDNPLLFESPTLVSRQLWRPRVATMLEISSCLSSGLSSGLRTAQASSRVSRVVSIEKKASFCST